MMVKNKKINEHSPIFAPLLTEDKHQNIMNITKREENDHYE